MRGAKVPLETENRCGVGERTRGAIHICSNQGGAKESWTVRRPNLSSAGGQQRGGNDGRAPGAGRRLERAGGRIGAAIGGRTLSGGGGRPPDVGGNGRRTGRGEAGFGRAVAAALDRAARTGGREPDRLCRVFGHRPVLRRPRAAGGDPTRRAALRAPLL